MFTACNLSEELARTAARPDVILSSLSVTPEPSQVQSLLMADGCAAASLQ